MKIKIALAMSIVLPIAALVIEIANGLVQAQLQEYEMAEFEKTLVSKYGLTEVM